MEEFDLTVIGAGPGGYVAAIRAAQLGLKTAIIEKRKTLGGTCLNVGCIPSKALLDSSEQYHLTKHKLEDHGITAKDVKIDISKMIQRKDKIVSEVCDGVDYLMKKNKITRFHGFGKLKKQTEIDITAEDGTTTTVKV
jgi:dihydrolipoamide dehydrogenase